MTSTITQTTPILHLQLFSGDTWDGVYPNIYDDNQAELNLTDSTFAASVYEGDTVVTAMEVEVVTPATQGILRLWMTSAQTALLTQSISVADVDASCDTDVINFSPYSYEVVRTFPQQSAGLTSLNTSGQFTASEQHFLSAGDSITFRNTAEPTINGNTYTVTTIGSETEFTVGAITGITQAALGGDVYQFQVDRVLVGKVVALRQ